MSTGWKGGSTRAWRRTRALVLLRDNYQCQININGVCVRQADQVHHTRGKAMGDDPTYLVAACGPCNRRIGDPTKRPDPPPTPRTRW